MKPSENIAAGEHYLECALDHANDEFVAIAHFLAAIAKLLAEREDP